MNLSKHIEKFYLWRRSRPISSTAADLYIFLLHECANAEGTNPIELSDRYVMGYLSISRHVLRKARTSLFEEGLIRFAVGVGDRSTIYRLTQVRAKQGVTLGQHHGESPSAYPVDSEIPPEQIVGKAPAGPTAAPPPEAGSAPPANPETVGGKPRASDGRDASESAPIMPLPFDAVEALYRAHCPNLSARIRRSARLVENVRQGLLYLGREDMRPAAIRARLILAFDILNRNEFMQGKNERHWKAGMEWIFRPDKHVFQKIASGQIFARDGGAAGVDAYSTAGKDYSDAGAQREAAMLEEKARRETEERKRRIAEEERMYAARGMSSNVSFAGAACC